MADIGIDIKLGWREQRRLVKGMRTLGGKLVRKHVGKAATAAMKPVIKDARRSVPVRYGQLKKSIGSRRKTYRHSGVVWVGVGPRAGFKMAMAKAGGGVEYVNPVNYAHLVEFGTQTAAPQPFLRPAFDAHKRPAVNRFTRMVLVGLDKEVRLMRARAS